MFLCNYGHAEICYQSVACPVCELLATVAKLKEQVEVDVETIMKNRKGNDHDRDNGNHNDTGRRSADNGGGGTESHSSGP